MTRGVSLCRASLRPNSSLWTSAQTRVASAKGGGMKQEADYREVSA